jgi:hypothetical protein
MYVSGKMRAVESIPELGEEDTDNRRMIEGVN